jgi:hypothetical protein
MEPTLTTPIQQTRVPTKTAPSCTHSRLVDEVRNTKGLKTGQLLCMECMTQFPDPTYLTHQK